MSSLQKNTASAIRDQIDVLRVALFKANAHYQIGMGLRAHWLKFARAIHNTRTFWEFTLEAHLNVAFVHVCRVFVEQKKATTLTTFLRTVHEHWDLFQEHEFRRRYANRPHLNEWLAQRWNPDHSQLAKDQKFCSVKPCNEEDGPVDLLIKWRHNIAMHIAPDWIGNQRNKFIKRWPLPDLKPLIDVGIDIVNRYNSAFQFVPAPPPLELDDYLRVLECLS